MSFRGRYIWTAVSGLALGFAGLSVSSVRADAPTTEPSKQQLIDRVNQMQTQMDQMKAQLDAQQVSTADEQAAIAKLLADADKRSKLMDSDGTLSAGWNPDKKQFFIGDNTNFYFHPGVIFQFRYDGDYQNRNTTKDAGGVTQTNVFNSGFEVTRGKFYFDGFVFSKDLTYLVQWKDANNGGSPSLEYAWAKYVFAHNVVGDGDLAVRAGQFKDPTFKEEAGVGDPFQPLAERSLANYLVGGVGAFTAGGGNAYTQGIDLQLTGSKSPLHANLVFDDGYNSANSDYTNNLDQGATQTNFGAAARVDYKVMGDWVDAGDLTGMQNGKNDLLVIGAGANFSEASPIPAAAAASNFGYNVIRYTIDAQYQAAHKFTLYGAFLGDYTNYRGVGIPAADSRDVNDCGGVIEGGYSLNNNWQLVARYSVTELNNKVYRPAGYPTQYNELGLGINYYMGTDGSWANNSKVTFDVDYLPNGVPSGISTTNSLDYLPTSAGKDAFVFRLQYQLML